MVPMARLRTTAVLGAALLTAGCFEMKQDFRFNTDGTADVTFRIAIDAALMALANQQGGNGNFCSEANVTREGVVGTAKASTEGGDMVCTLTISGPIEKVIDAALNAKLNDRAKEQQGISLTKDGETYALAIELPAIGDEPDTDNPMAKSMQAMMLAKMSGRTLSWSVMAPKIIETTGTLSDDGKVATYSRPVADAFTSKEPTRFSVRFSLRSPGFFDWIWSLFG